MPSQLHEALLLLFRNRPELAPEVLREALHVALPAYSEARIEEADLTDIQPAEYRADLVVLLYDGKPVLGIVIEVQLATDEDKRFVWPVYAAGLRARIRCPVCLLVVAVEERVARWAAQPVELGGGNRFAPLVLAPSGIPEITDVQRAKADAELAVLSAMAHGKDREPEKALEIAVAAIEASVGLDEERSRLYFDLVLHSLSEAARKALQSMDPARYEYQSEFARRYVAQGRAEGKAEGMAEGEAKGRAEGMAKGEAKGKAELLLRLLVRRFGRVSAEVEQRVRAASIEELDTFAERVLTAESLDEVLAPV